MPGQSVAILEDEQTEAALLLDWLTREGYKPYHCDNGGDFLQRVREEPPDIYILDWQLPDCEGIDIIGELRESLGVSSPIVFATARDSEEDIVRGLNSGADDYLIKPLRRAELLARLSAVWRRSGDGDEDTIDAGPIVLDGSNCRATVNGRDIELTATEFRLAQCVFANVGKLLSREFLLKEVWGIEASLDTRKVDMHMSKIRRLLDIGPETGYCIKTVYRHGYRLEQL